MIVTLTHIGNSWWWEQHKCTITCSDGRVVDPEIHVGPNTGMAYEVHETEEGIEARYFRCSSGRGKDYLFSKLLIPSKEYCEVKHEGKEPEHPGDDAVAFVNERDLDGVTPETQAVFENIDHYEIIRQLIKFANHDWPRIEKRGELDWPELREQILTRAYQFLLTE
ncbi:MAG: hypothetical protein ACK5XQ_02385 [Flavobacteriales bacterium]